MRLTVSSTASVDCGTASVEPGLPLVEHVTVWKDFENLARDAFSFEPISPSKFPLAVDDLRADIKQREFRLDPEISKDLPQGKFFVEKEALALR